MYSNMDPNTTPSLISKGGGVSDTPPPGVERNQHPLGDRVKELEVRILLPKLVMILWFDEPDLKWQIFDSVKQKLVFDIPFL